VCAHSAASRSDAVPINPIVLRLDADRWWTLTRFSHFLAEMNAGRHLAL
jgi:hypothetical protein